MYGVVTPITDLSVTYMHYHIRAESIGYLWDSTVSTYNKDFHRYCSRASRATVKVGVLTSDSKWGAENTFFSLTV